ncbi:MAG: hypothetical protein U0V75_09070 [Ferruginibacter sp.]
MKAAPATVKKVTNLALVIFSMLGYLQWGNNYHAFLFEGEKEVLSKLFTDPLAALHPFTIIPLLGQIILLYTLFQKEPGKWQTFTGIACIGLLLLLILFIGIISLRAGTVVSVLPFMTAAVYAIYLHRRSSLKK